ncbi:MAG: hypothetical protein JWL65_7181, partial [Gammaproteobacteria bacterium]|nr:hypothetical protein [Gammaproteobacteria bacterium]
VQSAHQAAPANSVVAVAGAPNRSEALTT